jgi:hypothetical protein
MTSEEEQQRERVIQGITEMLKINPFTFEFKVKKKPKGIKVIYEVTQEQLNEMMNEAKQDWGKKKP